MTTQATTTVNAVEVAVIAAIAAAATAEDLTDAIREIEGIEEFIGQPDEYYAPDYMSPGKFFDYYHNFYRAVAAAFFNENAVDTNEFLLDPRELFGVSGLGDDEAEDGRVPAWNVEIGAGNQTHILCDFSDLRDCSSIQDLFGNDELSGDLLWTNKPGEPCYTSLTGRG
jgi:hypothetical protein